MSNFVTRDSGVRASYASGMVRDTQDGKPRFDLLISEGVPYEDQFLTRIAELMARGIEKYGERNWEQADSVEEVRRFKASAFRHLMQWMCGERDEDHAAAVVFNLMAAETTESKIGDREPERASILDEPKPECPRKGECLARIGVWIPDSSETSWSCGSCDNPTPSCPRIGGCLAVIGAESDNPDPVLYHCAPCGRVPRDISSRLQGRS